MNPHFIFNCLNSIQGQIGKVEDRKVKYNLSKFSKLMRSTLNHSRQENISLEEEIELLNNYLTLEQMSRNQSFDFDIKVNDNLDVQNTFIPPLMLQPFVENAIIHGVAQLDKRRGQIDIDFKIKGKYLLCEIKDNGIGRKAARTIKSQQAIKNKSVALKVNSERLDLLHKDKKLKALIIEDLLDENKEGIGTLIVMHLPLSILDN
jgi:LytS/YehU family sensor histidine kinase